MCFLKLYVLGVYRPSPRLYALGVILFIPRSVLGVHLPCATAVLPCLVDIPCHGSSALVVLVKTWCVQALVEALPVLDGNPGVYALWEFSAVSQINRVKGILGT